MAERSKTKKEFEEILLEVRKVTRVTTGGRRMSFRATILAGNKKGKIGLGLAKGVDVSSAVKKATNEAYKNMFNVPITKDKSVPYAIENKFKACRVRVIPATQGTGLKAGSSVRSVLDLAGYENILSKIVGSNNKLNNAIATVNALIKYKHPEYFTTFDKAKGDEIKEDAQKEEKKVKIEKKETVAKKITTKKDISSKKVEKKPTKAPAKKSETKKELTKKPITKKATTKKDSK